MILRLGTLSLKSFEHVRISTFQKERLFEVPIKNLPSVVLVKRPPHKTNDERKSSIYVCSLFAGRQRDLDGSETNCSMDILGFKERVRRSFTTGTRCIDSRSIFRRQKPSVNLRSFLALAAFLGMKKKEVFLSFET
ncbi:uncharacterized protein LOC122530306 [Frieseomelitta varia]|uniref:uncharacterized protein LOC122530306 n=1 Tax=Frieseomelitta varia TaxID=561572 RepID=UPI001CB68E99|nr:uncharacterized protein LOC122530306 [Frieseomelitta varia]